LDNFGKILKFQMGDMKQSNFSNFQWTAKGIQMQSLPSQPHVDAKRAAKLLHPDDFNQEGEHMGVMPADLLDEDLIGDFQRDWLDAQDRIESVLDLNTYASQNVTRVPLKLPVPRAAGQPNSILNVPEVCTTCLRQRDDPRCDCARFGVFLPDGKPEGGRSIHASDEMSGSPDGLLNFHPSDLLPHAIGTRVGLAKLMAHFNIEHGTEGRVKIVNSDIDIYARIIKVKAHCVYSF